MGSIANITYVLPADVANNATFTVAYPAGQTQASLTNSTGGVMTLNDADILRQGTGVTFTFGASNITVTNLAGYTLPAGTRLLFSFGNTARNGSYNLTIGTEYNQAKRGDA